MNKFVNTPFNYTGSKFKLLGQIVPLFDYNKENFVDIFAGGGSVWSNVAHKYNKVLVNDIIYELIEVQKLLLTNPDSIIQKTKKLCVEKGDKEGYYNLRNSFNQNKTPEKLWALLLCCNNNMLRFNQKFEFNQTYGNRTWNGNTTKKVDAFVKHILNLEGKILFLSRNFYEIRIKKPSMIYLDPPYLETEAGYNNYWSKESDVKLYEYIKELNRKGSSFALSGVVGEHKDGKRSKLVDTLIEEGYNYEILEHNYEMVAKKKNSKNSQEILIFNY